MMHKRIRDLSVQPMKTDHFRDKANRDSLFCCNLFHGEMIDLVVEYNLIFKIIADSSAYDLKRNEVNLEYKA